MAAKKIYGLLENQVITLLRLFTKKDLNDFQAFVACTFFNTDQYVVQLCHQLEKMVLRELKLDEGLQCKLYQAIFKDAVDASLNLEQKRRLHFKMGILHRLAKRFLIIKKLEENKAEKHRLLYQVLLESKQWSSYKRQLSGDQKYLQMAQGKDIAYYHFAYEVEDAKLQYLYQQGLLLQEDNLADLTYQLDVSYLLHKLKLQITTLSIQQASNKGSTEDSTMNLVFQYLERPAYKNHPLLQLNKVSILLIKTHEQTYYKQLLDLLEIHRDALVPQDIKDFYIVASNFCLYQIRMGVVAYNQTLYELYQFMDDKNLLMESDSVTLRMLKNMVSIACHLTHFKWAKTIADKYRLAIQKDLQESVWQYNLGLIAFYKNSYKDAIGHFIRVDKINLSFDVDCKIMLIKSHYQLDTDYDERSMQIFRSAAQFIKNNKALPTSHRKSYTNLIQLLINLYRIKHRVGKMTLESVQKKISKMEFIGDKRWLLEKLEELGK